MSFLSVIPRLARLTEGFTKKPDLFALRHRYEELLALSFEHVVTMHARVELRTPSLIGTHTQVSVVTLVARDGALLLLTDKADHRLRLSTDGLLYWGTKTVHLSERDVDRAMAIALGGVPALHNWRQHYREKVTNIRQAELAAYTLLSTMTNGGLTQADYHDLVDFTVKAACKKDPALHQWPRLLDTLRVVLPEQLAAVAVVQRHSDALSQQRLAVKKLRQGITHAVTLVSTPAVLDATPQ